MNPRLRPLRLVLLGPALFLALLGGVGACASQATPPRPTPTAIAPLPGARPGISAVPTYTPTPIPPLEPARLSPASTPTRTSSPAPTDLPTGEEAPLSDPSLPPFLVELDPPPERPWRGEPVTLAFQRPLDPASALGVHLSPPLSVEVTVHGPRLRISPQARPRPGTVYRLTLDARIRTADGVPLPGLQEILLRVPAPLEVAALQPGDGTTVAPDVAIQVIFNRPVVDLASPSETSERPMPLRIEPRLDGRGQWVSPGIFRFVPQPSLAPGTSYTVTVADVVDLGGEALAQPVTVRFRVAGPQVLAYRPSAGPVPLDTPVILEFNQPMDRASTQAAFRLQAAGSREPPVPGTFRWEDDGRRLVFQPQRLELDTTYQVTLAQEARSAWGAATLEGPVTFSFVTVPRPGVVETIPQPGARNTPPENGVFLQFQGVISPSTLLPKVQITPRVTETTVYSYFSEYENRLYLNWAKRSHTAYTVTVGPGVQDLWGHSMERPFVLTFTTGALSPWVDLDLPQFTHLTPFTRTSVPVQYRGVDRLRVALYRLPVQEVLRLTGPEGWRLWRGYTPPDPKDHRIWARTFPVEPDPDRMQTFRVPLEDEAGQPLPPGVYLVTVVLPFRQAQAAEDTHDRAVVILSRYNLAVKKTFQGPSMAWLTDLATGQPVSRQPVTFLQLQQGAEEVWIRRVVGQAQTGPDGVAMAALELDTTRTWLPLLAVSGEPGHPSFALASSAWNEGVEPWTFQIPLSYEAARIQAVFYTERPIYRPGQTVHWKGIVRVLQDDRLQAPPEGTPVEVTVWDDQGNELLRTQVTTNRFGTVHGELPLSPEAVTGLYNLEAVVQPTSSQRTYTGVTFQVAEYRPPEFQVSVQAETPDVVQGETITVVVEATYFSGGPLAHAPVEWRLLAEPYTFAWDDAPQEPRYSFAQVDLEDPTLSPYSSPRMGLVRQGRGTTDAQGRLIITLTADLQGSPFSQRWTLDATVRSPTNQFVSGRDRVTVHRSGLYVGVAAERAVVGVGQPSAFQVVAVDPRGARMAQVPLVATIHRYRWSSVRVRAPDGTVYWESQVERTPVYTVEVTTDLRGEATFLWSPEAGGQYQIIVSGQDAAARPSTGSLFTWVWDRSQVYVPWRRDNNDRLEPIPDRELYRPGDVAQILVPSPFPGPVQALVTVERGGILSHTVQLLPGNSTVISVPIQGDYLPNVYVSVLLVRPGTPENPVPGLALGYARLAVDPSSQALDLQIQASTQQARPGQTVTYTVTVRDRDGRPVADAELSAALVDKAVLSLSRPQVPSLLSAFYREQPLGVSTGILLAINRDRLNQLVSEGGKGGGGGGPGGVVSLREQFADLAFWAADLTPDARGQVTFTVALPDNLTTWELVVRAITPDTQVGDRSHELVATKELRLRPALPRFLTAGDRVQIGALVQNATERDLGAVVIAAHVEGAHFVQPVGPITATLGPGAQFQRLDWLTIPRSSTGVTLTFTARSPTTGLEDGVRIRLPVLRYRSRETAASAGRVPPAGRVELIRRPTAPSDGAELVVRLEASLAAGMLAGLDYLKHFPYECVEQTISRFLPNLVTAQALRRLDVAMPELEADLAFQVGVGLQRLIYRQNPDGGWGWWSNMASNRFVSAYALWALWQAHRAGYPVPAHVLDRGADYLRQGWTAPARVQERWELNQMAFAHFVLAQMGQGDPGRMSTLYGERQRLSLYGRAFLALAMERVAQEEGQVDPRVAILVDELLSRAQVSPTATWWQEDRVDWHGMNTDTRTTAILVYALARLRPQEPRLPGAVRWLMASRRQGRWSTTQDNAWAILALTEWMAVTGELEADYTWTVALDRKRVGQGHFGPENLDTPTTFQIPLETLRPDEGLSLLVLQRDPGPGQLYYTAFLRTYQDAPQIAPVDQGLAVSRQFLQEQGPQAGQPVTRVRVGEWVQVAVDLAVPRGARYLLLEVPIPAGTEILDPRLATTAAGLAEPEQLSLAPEARGPGRGPWSGGWLPDHVDIRDEKVTFFAETLVPGSYRYTFRIRAVRPGTYNVLPAQAELMYFPEIWGRSAGAVFTVEE